MDFLTARYVRALFVKQLELYQKGWVSDISTYYDSDMAVEEYPFLGDVPRLTEARGPVKGDDLRQAKILVRNKDLDLGLRISPKDFRRDKTGSVAARMQEAVAATVDWWFEKHSAMINDGTVDLAFDDKAFFATDHEWGSSGVWSNLINYNLNDTPLAAAEVGTVAFPSAVGIMYAIFAGVKAIMRAKSDKGFIMHKNPREFTVMGPIDYMAQLKTAVSSLNIGQSRPNELLLAGSGDDGFKVNLVINPELSATDALYIFRSDSNRKPFLHQSEIDPRSKFLGPDSEYGTLNNHLLLVVKATREAANGDHRLAVKVTITKI